MNLGRRYDPILLTWSVHGVLLPAGGANPARQQTEAQDDLAVVTAIHAAIAAGADIPTVRNGPATTYIFLSTFEALPKTLTKSRFWAALDRLQSGGKIGRET